MNDEAGFYKALLDLGMATELDVLVEQALALVLRTGPGERGYLAVLDHDGTVGWRAAHDLEGQDLEAIVASTSSGIARAAMDSGQTISTASAMLDERFRDLESVRRNKVDAVLCVPIGSPALGVLVLQGRPGGPSFAAADIERAETFATHLAPYADRLLQRTDQGDPTAVWRERIRADAVIGRSPAVAAMLKQVAMVAPIDVPVLLQGPTGVGKTSVAQVIHASGDRADQPLVILNCATLPATLAESELFGAERGAHSTATRAVPGKLEAAGRGTLVLDEIGELDPSIQAKLLQVVQDGTYWPLGSTTERKARCRIVAATNVDLEAAIRDGAFREDLYFRLSVFRIEVPSLAARGADALQLAAHFVNEVASRHGLPRLALSPAARAAILGHGWPGNVRELRNAIERGVVVAATEQAPRIEADHLGLAAAPAVADDDALANQTRMFQGALIRRLMQEEEGNVSAVARRLAIHRSHLYTLLKVHGLR